MKKRILIGLAIAALVLTVCGALFLFREDPHPEELAGEYRLCVYLYQNSLLSDRPFSLTLNPDGSCQRTVWAEKEGTWSVSRDLLVLKFPDSEKIYLQVKDGALVETCADLTCVYTKDGQLPEPYRSILAHTPTTPPATVPPATMPPIPTSPIATEPGTTTPTEPGTTTPTEPVPTQPPATEPPVPIEVAGSYQLVSAKVMGISYGSTALKLLGLKGTLVLRADGTGTATIKGETYSVTWNHSSISAMGYTAGYTFDGEYLYGSLGDNTVTLRRTN